MKLVMTLLVRDEADIINENIAFHLEQGVDHIVATDNASVDGTREILAQYQRQGVLTLIDEPSTDYLQAPWTNRMVALAIDQHDAQWVFCNDADEFWCPNQGTLKSLVQTSESEGIRVLSGRRTHMIAPFETLAGEHWKEALIWRRDPPPPVRVPYDIYRGRLRNPLFYCNLPPKVLFSTKDYLEVEMGAHRVQHEDGLLPVVPAPITVFHYPLRDTKAFITGVRQKGEAAERNPNLKPGECWKTRRWVRMLNEGKPERSVLAEALPSQRRFRIDKFLGRVVKDTRMWDRFFSQH